MSKQNIGFGKCLPPTSIIIPAYHEANKTSSGKLGPGDHYHSSTNIATFVGALPRRTFTFCGTKVGFEQSPMYIIENWKLNLQHHHHLVPVPEKHRIRNVHPRRGGNSRGMSVNFPCKSFGSAHAAAATAKASPGFLQQRRGDAIDIDISCDFHNLVLDSPALWVF